MYHNKFLILLKSVVLLLLLCLTANAQSIDIASIGKAKPVQLSGAVNANSVFSYGLPNTEKPINYFLAGNLNINVFNTVNIPINFNFSDRKIALSQSYSFNQFSISPTYKWATALIGTNYMSFSQYTLNGHQFLGGGLDLKPGKWRIRLMDGRLRKGQKSGGENNVDPEFKRNGLGGRVDYNAGKYTAGLTVFKSRDVATTLGDTNRITSEGQIVNPEDNLVIGLNFGTTLFSSLQFDVEFANSMVTKDRSPNYEAIRAKGLAGLFLKGNATSESYNAFKTNLAYNIKQSNTLIGVGYERVDPGYETHGGYYFIEDIVNYTFNISQTLLENKINFSGNMGVQQEGVKKKQALRFVAAVNATAQVREDINMGLNFSNFSSYIYLQDLFTTTTRVPGQPVDSLDFSMLSQNLSYNVNKSLRKNDKITESVSWNINYLQSKNKVGDLIKIDGKTNIINTTVSYNLNFVASKLNLSGGLNYLNNKIGGNALSGYGPTVNVAKEIIESKFRTGLNFTFLRTDSFNKELGVTDKSTATNLQFNSTYNPAQKHSFFANAGFVDNNSIKPFFNGTLGYTYSF